MNRPQVKKEWQERWRFFFYRYHTLTGSSSKEKYWMAMKETMSDLKFKIR